jgi:hypothetical protein
MSGRLVIFVALLVAPFKVMTQSQEQDLQTIIYRGGVVEFSVPRQWTAQYGDEGGGIFWDPQFDGGTLRLDLLTFEKGGKLGPSPAREILQSLRGEGVVRELPDGNAVREYQSHIEEDGEQLKQFYWEVGNCVGPNHFRLAIFSYTILEAHEGEAAIQRELAVLRRTIPAAVFSEQLGR